MLGGYWESVAIFLGINVLMGISLYIPMTAGLISLGQGGFMAIGAYVCAMLTKSDVPFVFALVAGAAPLPWPAWWPVRRHCAFAAST